MIQDKPLSAPAAILGGALCLLAFHAARLAMRHGDSLGLGSIDEPTPLYGRFLALWLVFGTAAAALLALGLVRAVAPYGKSLAGAWNRGTDGKWMLYGVLFSLLIPVLIRKYVLLGMPVADDEAAYHLMAEILAQGRLYGESHPLKLFFDNRFLINDGKLYAQYFVGWPALAAPGVWFGLAEYMNAFYAALASVPVFLVVRRLAGSAWARAALILYVTSPLLMVGAATELSHTSCLTALAWCLWFSLVAGDRPSPWWAHFGMAATFSVAFFIRPVSALGLALPWLCIWLWKLRGVPPGPLGRRLAAFALPAVGMAFLFLAVNQVQHGSAFAVGYDRYYEYSEANDFRFSLFSEPSEQALPDFEFSDVFGSLGKTSLALFRFHFAFLGWPVLLFAIFAGGRRLWSAVFCFVAVHFFTNSIGIDVFAPVHYFELALPVLVLTILGAQRLQSWLAGGDSMWRGLVPCLLVSLVVVGLAGYTPVRLREAHRLAEAVYMPWRALEEAGIDRAVVFTSSPFVSSCHSRPSSPLVFARPNNDPAFQNDVLWVNHVSLEENRRLMEYFPDRPGYVMGWLRSCEVVMQPLDGIPPGSLPPTRFR